MSATTHTRRLYQFDDLLLESLPYAARRKRSRASLESTLAEVWAVHGRKNLDAPILTINGDQSYADGYRHINLAKHDANRIVLLHEVTHALGYGKPHGPGFVRKYIALLAEFAQADAEQLALTAGIFKL